MKIILILGLIALVLLSSCTIQETKYVCFDGYIVNDSTQCKLRDATYPPNIPKDICNTTGIY